VPAALAPTGMSVSYPKARLDGHALDPYPVSDGKLIRARYRETLPRHPLIDRTPQPAA